MQLLTALRLFAYEYKKYQVPNEDNDSYSASFYSHYFIHLNKISPFLLLSIKFQIASSTQKLFYRIE
jgi:hypothetical protein